MLKKHQTKSASITFSSLQLYQKKNSTSTLDKANNQLQKVSHLLKYIFEIISIIVLLIIIMGIISILIYQINKHQLNIHFLYTLMALIITSLPIIIKM